MNLFFTCGDYNGIGPEVAVKTLSAFQKQKQHKLYICIPQNVFEEVRTLTKKKFPVEYIADVSKANSDKRIVSVLLLPKGKIVLGKTTKQSGMTAFSSIQKAFDAVQRGFADCIITAPISKEAFHKAGIKYPGHTELFADWTNAKDHLMFFHSAKMRAALLTIHVPIASVSDMLSEKLITSKLRIVQDSLKKDFGVPSPNIAVLGLNPHAGESGLLGREEKDVFASVMKKFGKSVSGPFPADAFFGNHSYKKYDALVGAYHDQVLIPFKMLSFEDGVNFTAGLPIVRTSPDHGTAFDIAGKGIANPLSMIAAANLAVIICSNRKRYAKKN